MRILMMTASLPYPPHQGGALRAYGLLDGLYAAGHQVTLLSFHDPDRGVSIEETPLATICEQVITVPAPHRHLTDRLRDLLMTSHADISRRLESAAMHGALRRLLSEQDFDLVQFEGIEITNYLFTAQQARPDIPTVYDSFNAEAALQQIIATVDRGDPLRLPNAIYSQIQSHRIEQYERAICRAATEVIAVSREDADILRQFREDNTVHEVPSGVFAADYTTPGVDLQLAPNAIVFTGKMDYRPNVDAMMWFASDILPGITQHIEATLYIVGQKPHRRLEQLRPNPHIEITGWVSEIPPYLHAADVYVAPLRMGSGTRLKILEAMAAGCAVVATTTAASGLVDAAKSNMVIADNEAATATAVRELLAQPERRRSLGSSAQAFITTHYDWAQIIPRLLNVYQHMGLHSG